MSVATFSDLKKAETRARMQALQRARKSRRAAQAEQRAAGMLNGSVGKITNLRQILSAMAEQTL